MEAECGLEELYGTPSTVVPQTLPIEPQAWQRLVKMEYGACMWDTVMIEGIPMVAWLVREAARDVQHLPDKVDALWKVVAIGMDVMGYRVMPIITLIHFLPLDVIYETWFNFYGVDGPIVQEALGMLQFQLMLPLLFLDHGPVPVRKFGFTNNMTTNLKGIYGMISSVPAWTDEAFDTAKIRIEERYTSEDLLAMK